MAAKQRKFHITTEVLGVLLGVYLIFVGYYFEGLPSLVRASLAVFGATGMAVDGNCIATWFR